MPRFSASLTMLFGELPFLERFPAAAAAGFGAVEVQFPYDLPAPRILEALARNDLALVAINHPPPNYTGRPRGFAAVPGGEALFRQDFRRAARVARALGAGILHVMAGKAAGPAARVSMAENLRWAAAEAPDLTLTIEPQNPQDMPGGFLDDFDLALSLIDEVGAPNLRLQFDAYHIHALTGDIAAAWARARTVVGHVQVAGHPGRAEPAGGGIDYPAFFRLLDGDGYRGWVGAEYQPAAGTLAGLGWLAGARA